MGRFLHERVMPDDSDGQYVIHKVRYEFASGHATGRRVLDAGCGAGYGTAMLARTADRVLGIDDDPGIMAWARKHYPRPNVVHAVMDVQRMALPAESFDLVVSLQVMEHVRDVDAYLAEIWRVLRPAGTLVVSTENEEVHHVHLASAGIPDADSHVNVMTIARFRRAIGKHFGSVRYLCQRPRRPWYHTLLKALDVFNLRLRLLGPGTRERILEALRASPTDGLSVDDYVVSPWLIRQAPIQIAVCRK